MNRDRNRTGALVLAGALALAVPALPAGASGGSAVDTSAKPLTLAFIGDTPYGAAQEATFGELVDAIDADPKVRAVTHVGDIKSGGTTCTDERFAAVAASFASFDDPVVYTPGDNEWTDCHRPAAGGYDPLERLERIREVFFAEPGRTSGQRPKLVDAQATLVENVRWVESRVAFATLHVVGSDNGLAPWTGNAAPTDAQLAEVEARTDATLSWIDETFDVAEAGGLRGVVLAMQADTWPNPSAGFVAITDRIAERTAAFDGEVLVIQGDSHQYLVDNPLGLENFTRIVVHGATLPFEYLRLTVDPRGQELFSWERVPVTG